MCPGPFLLGTVFCSASQSLCAKLLSSTAPFSHHVSTLEPADHVLNALELGVKSVLSSFKL